MIRAQNGTDIRAVLLDLDGTLINSKLMSNIVVERLFEKHRGIKVKNAHDQRFHGMPTRQILAHIDPQRVDELLDECMAMEDEYRHLMHLFPGVLEALNLLKDSQLRIGVVTSQARVEMEANRRYFGLDRYVDVWVSSDDVEASKPDPSALLQALEILDCQPDQAVMVGDSRFDMQAGQLAGTWLGAALWGLSEYHDLLRFKPRFAFYHADEMVRLCQ